MSDKPKNNLLPLKVLVISLGLVLVGGFVFVVAVLVTKIPGKGVECASKEITLPVQGTVDGFSSDPHTWRAVVRTQDGYSLVTIDACSGRIINTLTIKQ